MARLDLKIAEAKLDEFEAWFREFNPLPAMAEVVSFDREPGSADVVYNVRANVGSAAAATLAKSTWAYQAPPPGEVGA